MMPPPGKEIARIPFTNSELSVTEHTAADLMISQDTRDRLLEGIRPNTLRAYERQWTTFVAWCRDEDRTPLVATPQTLAEYVSQLCAAGKAPASIDQAIATIRVFHRRAGHPNHPDTEAALLALRGYKRTRAMNGKRNQREAPPVTIDALRAMIGVCDLSSPLGVRNRLLLVLGLALMGRRSELVALVIDDVIETGEGLEVLIRTSKTDKNSVGETIAIPRGSHPLTDPVAVWQDWLAVLADSGITTGRLLRSVDRHNRIGLSLSTDAVNTTVRRLAVEAGVPSADRYTAHSLRAGGATVAYAAGIPVSVIAKHGRWEPKSPVVLKYIRAVDRWKDNAMRNVGL